MKLEVTTRNHSLETELCNDVRSAKKLKVSYSLLKLAASRQPQMLQNEDVDDIEAQMGLLGRVNTAQNAGFQWLGH